MTPSLAMDFNNKFVAHFIAVPSSLPNSHFPFEVYYASWQQCCYELRREHEFHFVSGIVVISCQDHSDGGIIVQCGVSTPLGTLVGRKFAGPLDFEEEDAFSEGVMVVIATAEAMPEGDQRQVEENERS